MVKTWNVGFGCGGSEGNWIVELRREGKKKEKNKRGYNLSLVAGALPPLFLVLDRQGCVWFSDYTHSLLLSSQCTTRCHCPLPLWPSVNSLLFPPTLPPPLLSSTLLSHYHSFESNTILSHSQLHNQPLSLFLSPSISLFSLHSSLLFLSNRPQWIITSITIHFSLSPHLSSPTMGSDAAATKLSSSESLNGLKFGQKIYFEDVGLATPATSLTSAAAVAAGVTSSSSSSSRKGRGGSVQPAQPPRCQVEGCMVDLSDAKAYYSRHKVCGMHSKSPTVIVAGLQQRFCQQCSRSTLLSLLLLPETKNSFLFFFLRSFNILL